jgi:hypothetical protein
MLATFLFVREVFVNPLPAGVAAGVMRYHACDTELAAAMSEPTTEV